MPPSRIVCVKLPGKARVLVCDPRKRFIQHRPRQFPECHARMSHGAHVAVGMQKDWHNIETSGTMARIRWTNVRAHIGTQWPSVQAGRPTPGQFYFNLSFSSHCAYCLTMSLAFWTRYGGSCITLRIRCFGSVHSTACFNEPEHD